MVPKKDFKDIQRVILRMLFTYNTCQKLALCFKHLQGNFLRLLTIHMSAYSSVQNSSLQSSKQLCFERNLSCVWHKNFRGCKMNCHYEVFACCGFQKMSKSYNLTLEALDSVTEYF